MRMHERMALWRGLRAARRAAALVSAAGLVAGCGALEVSDPTAVENEELNNAAGAEMLRRGALHDLTFATGHGALVGGLLADEFAFDLSPTPLTSSDRALAALDRRQSEEYEAYDLAVEYSNWQTARFSANVALDRLRRFGTEPPRRAHIGQMLAVRGFATLRLAEDFCPGFPLHDLVDFAPVYSGPYTTEAALAAALADFDSAVAYTADSTRLLHFAQVGRARTLLALGRFAEAGEAAEPVPTAFVWNAEFSSSAGLSNPLRFIRTATNSRFSVADREGGNGLDFVSAGDPRVPTTRMGPAYDGTTQLYSPSRYANVNAPIVLASGVEARLIEAEAALQAGDRRWLDLLNDLRQTQVSPPLPPLADPGTPDARVDLLFRERAFWLFGTGHRLADLRRLVRHYGRTPEEVFPSGDYRQGGSYGRATSIPFPAVRERAFSASVTGCMSR